MTAEQLEAARAERLRQNGHGTLVLEDARTWVEETGLCHFLPRRQSTAAVAPSFIEAVAGREEATPDPRFITTSEELLVRLEADDVALRLNLNGMPTEQPDYIVAAWVLPYVYALRGDRDWRRTPQLTGSRQVSPLAIQAYKLLEMEDATVSQLRTALGREVSETAVLRAITELWQQLRIIPIVSAPGAPARWQLLRHRFQKAIAEGASTSQVTAISVLASIYLQAVIAASMEEVELFLAPLTSRSKVREVLRGLVATRQVNTTTVGHSSYFYVAGTLPEFAPPPTTYINTSISTYSYGYRGREEEHVISVSASEGVSSVSPVSIAGVSNAAGSVVPGKSSLPARPEKKGLAASTPRSASHRPDSHSKPKSAERHSRSAPPSRSAAPAPRSAHKPGSGTRVSHSSTGASSKGASRPSAFKASSNGMKTPNHARPAAKSNGAGGHKAGEHKTTGAPVRNAMGAKPRTAMSSGVRPAAKSSTAAVRSSRSGSGVRPAGRTEMRKSGGFVSGSGARTSAGRTSPAASRPSSARKPAARPPASRSGGGEASLKTGSARSVAARTSAGSASSRAAKTGTSVRRKPTATAPKSAGTASKRTASSRSASKKFEYAAPRKQESGKRK